MNRIELAEHRKSFFNHVTEPCKLIGCKPERWKEWEKGKREPLPGAVELLQELLAWRTAHVAAVVALSPTVWPVARDLVDWTSIGQSERTWRAGQTAAQRIAEQTGCRLARLDADDLINWDSSAIRDNWQSLADWAEQNGNVSG